MNYQNTVTLTNGQTCLLRTLTAEDAAETLTVFNRTHEETDYMLIYLEESTFGLSEETDFLRNAAQSDRKIEIGAFVDGVLVGSAGIGPVGDKIKNRHRAKFGIGILREYWHRGIGRELTAACIDCARSAGYLQLELEAVAENEHALALYRKAGFVEYGRNPKGFRTKDGRWQPLILMRLDLTEGD